MSVPVNFGNKVIIEPGAYAQTKSKIQQNPQDFPFGDVLILDTELGKNWGGGSGINGAISNGSDSIYSFSEKEDFKAFVGGGALWYLAEYVFNPFGNGESPDNIYFIRACNTIPSKMEFVLTNGNFNILCRNEGSVGNGVLNETRAHSFLSIDASEITDGKNISLSHDVSEFISPTTVQSDESPLSFKKRLVDLINSSNSGFNAKLSGIDIKILAPINEGSGFNGETIVLGGDIVGTASSFSNGEDGNEIIKGYSYSLKETSEGGEFYIEIRKGSYKGESEEGFVYSGIPIADSSSNKVIESPSFEYLSQLIDWMENDPNFNSDFKLESDYSISSDGELVASDIFQDKLSKKGGESYNPSDLDDVLEEIKELGFTFLLTTEYGEESNSVRTQKIFEHLRNDAIYEQFMVLGGGSNRYEFDSLSINTAKSFDSEKVVVVHDGFYKKDQINEKDYAFPSLYFAANVAGALGAMEPQEPLTFKSLLINNFTHQLKKGERIKALQSGVLHNRNVNGLGNVVNQGINSLQNNKQQILPSGKSFEISIMSISSQINKELILNINPLMVGSNKRKVTKADVTSFVQNYLLNKTEEENPLIIRFKNLNVTLNQGNYFVSYEYEPNGPINKFFLTGFMIDNNL